MQRSRFTNQVVERVVVEFSATPLLLAQLQEVMDGYLPPSDSTNVMNKVFAAMKPEVAAKTPRPVPGAKGERWLRPAAAPAGPVTPAVARPNRVLEAMRKQQGGGTGSAGGAASSEPGGQPAGVLAESSSGGAVWPWAVLGVGVLAWGWWRMRR